MCKGLQGLRDFYLAMEPLGCLLALQIPIRSIKPAVITFDSSYLPGNELVSFILIVNRQVSAPPKSTVTEALKRFFLAVSEKIQIKGQALNFSCIHTLILSKLPLLYQKRICSLIHYQHNVNF